MVGALNLPDGWIGVGFVRNTIWDHLHGRSPFPPAGDIDVIWHDPRRIDAVADREHEAALRRIEPAMAWSVKNQAKMHLRNDDDPYPSSTKAMRYWPETATAVAVRRVDGDGEVATPFGPGDLTGLVLLPTPRFAGGKRHVYEERV